MVEWPFALTTFFKSMEDCDAKKQSLAIARQERIRRDNMRISVSPRLLSGGRPCRIRPGLGWVDEPITEARQVNEVIRVTNEVVRIVQEMDRAHRKRTMLRVLVGALAAALVYFLLSF